jgi:gas vesicle protein
MNSETRKPADYRFAIGLLAGTFLGAGLAMWLAPKGGSELRGRLTSSAKRVGREASARYQEASARATDAVDELTRQGNAVRDDVANAVARGAHEVERLAKAARS